MRNQNWCDRGVNYHLIMTNWLFQLNADEIYSTLLMQTWSNFFKFQNQVEARLLEPLQQNLACAFRQNKSRFLKMDTLSTIKVLLATVPFENRVTITYNHQHTKQGNGYCWPHIALSQSILVRFVSNKCGKRVSSPGGVRRFKSGIFGVCGFEFFEWDRKSRRFSPPTLVKNVRYRC